MTDADGREPCHRCVSCGSRFWCAAGYAGQECKGLTPALYDSDECTLCFKKRNTTGLNL